MKRKPNMFQKYLRRAVAALCIICVVLGTPVHAFAESGGSSSDELIDEDSAESISESTDTTENSEELISEDSSDEDTSSANFSTENSSEGETVSSTDELIEESDENITQADSLSDGETLVDESAEENSSENTSVQIRRSTMRIRRAMTAQNTATPSFTITYEAGANSRFSNGTAENKVTYTHTHHDTNITKYSHTANIDDTGGNDGSYATDFSTTDIITIPGATKLTIDVWYSTDSSDWLAIYPAGITPSDSNYASASISGGKLSGGGAYSKSDATHKQFTVNGDTAQFYFKSNSSWFKWGTYGYYATITADGYDSYDATSGAYEEPVPNDSRKSFLGWYTDTSYSSKIEDPISLKTNSTVYAKIARYTDTGTWGTCPWGITKDGVLEIGAGTGGEPIREGSDIVSPWKTYSDKITAIKTTGAVKAPSSCMALFDGLSEVTSADLKDFDAGNVTNMSDMFNGCSKLTTLDVSGWNTGNVTYMNGMFFNCKALTSLDVSGWNTGKVTNMRYMFYGCSKLTTLDVSGWNTSNVEDMNSMFYGCKSLASLDLSKLDMSKVSSYYWKIDAMLQGTRLDKITLGTKCILSSGSYDAGLSTKNTGVYTGKWTYPNAENHENAITSSALMAQYKTAGSGVERTWYAEKYSSYTITFNANGDTGTMSPQAITGTTALSVNRFTRQNYAFYGWNTKADGTGTSYADGTSITPASDMTLYAQWIAVHAITFDANGGTGSMQPQTISNTGTIQANSFLNAHHTFAGWNTKADGTGTAYADKAQITPTADMTLYAQWKPFTYTIIFNENENTSGTMANETMSYGTAKALSNNAFEKRWRVRRESF